MRDEHVGRAVHRSGASLPEQLDAHLQACRLLPEGAALSIALSGGLDSVALLDLLETLRERWGWRLSAAHFDHRMREESGADAEWVAALCRERGVPCRVGRALRIPRSEAEARDLRYEFLHRARLEFDADWLATAHQADDQAETVLFRLLRGSGLAGLAGIPVRRAPCIVRPLLPFWRAEIEMYAASRGLAYLVDPTNLDLSIARNRIRHQLIPGIEAGEAPDLRRQLVRLAALARRATRVVARTTRRAVDELVLESSERRIIVARTALLAYDTHVRAHLLRALVARVGPRPGRVGTRIALEFINTGTSGRAIDLAGGIVMRREFDCLYIEPRQGEEVAEDGELVLEGPEGGAGEVEIAGVRWQVRWGLGTLPVGGVGHEQYACFDPSELGFPLIVRSWRPGDRIRLPAGTRKLKKVFVDRRVGRSQRRRHPLLADRTGVLWAVGLVRGVQALDRHEGSPFSVCLRREA